MFSVSLNLFVLVMIVKPISAFNHSYVCWAVGLVSLDCNWTCELWPNELFNNKQSRWIWYETNHEDLEKHSGGSVILWALFSAKGQANLVGSAIVDSLKYQNIWITNWS